MLAKAARSELADSALHARSAALGGHEFYILVVIFHSLADPSATFTDLGSDFYAKRIDKKRRTDNLVHQLEALGHCVTLSPAA